MSDQETKELEQEKKQREKALNETIEETIRQAWLPNTLAWVGVALGAFALNLLLLILVAGG
jgi:hypothetical protein